MQHDKQQHKHFYDSNCFQDTVATLAQ
jgi:hypothetical protein